MIAFLRPDAWDFPLFLHVLGATVLFGGVATLAIVSVAGLRVAEHAACCAGSRSARRSCWCGLRTW